MMQRKNKPPPPPAPVTEGPPSPTPTQKQPVNAESAKVATVVRRRCGTSPFDKHWLNMDCCGLFCAGLTYMLHLYGCYAVCTVLIPPWMSYLADDGIRKLTIWGILNNVAFCLVAAMAIISHAKAMTTDPGAVPPDATPLPPPEELASLIKEGGEEGTAVPSKTPAVASGAAGLGNGSEAGNGVNSGLGSAAAVAGAGVAVAGAAAAAAVSAAMPSKPAKHQRGRRICRRCNSYKPQRAHHCSVCKRCIIKMDHHCPWVNNCVGIGNHKYFLLFIFYTCLSCTYSVTLVIWRFIQCIGMHSRHQHCLDEPTHILSIIGLMAEALVFGIFTFCMMIDQWDVVMTNVTHIDRLKGETGFNFLDDQRRMGVNEVFGTGRGTTSHFRPDWLSPFVRVCFPSSLQDEIMGFCRPCRLSPVSKKDDDDMELGGKSHVIRSVPEIV